MRGGEWGVGGWGSEAGEGGLWRYRGRKKSAGRMENGEKG